MSMTHVGDQFYVANGERLHAQTYAQSLNIVGKDGWDLVCAAKRFTRAYYYFRSVLSEAAAR